MAGYAGRLTLACHSTPNSEREATTFRNSYLSETIMPTSSCIMPRVPEGEGQNVIRMEIQTVVVGGLQVPSLVVLKTRDDSHRQITLPIRIGPVEAACITAGVEGNPHKRPLTHDLMGTVIKALDGKLSSISIVDVQGTTFFATLQLVRADGTRTDVDCRPSDAISLAVRTGVPIYAKEQVLDTATMPDFQRVKKDTEEQELQAFHDFVEGLSPEDFQ